jgi:hypothetical protein
MKSIYTILFIVFACFVTAEKSVAQTISKTIAPQAKKMLTDEKGTAVSMNTSTYEYNGKVEKEITLTYVNDKGEGRRVDITNAQISRKGQVLGKYDFIGGEKIRVQQYLEHKGDKEPKVEIELL